MHTLNITGATPEELYLNVVKTLSIFLRGPGQAAPDALPAEPATAAVSDEKVERTSETAAASSSETTVLPPKTRKNAKADKAKVEPMPSDDISDVGGAGKTIEHEPKVLTLDGDIRPRLQAIQKAHTERGNDMPACVAYIQKLYGPFNIANAKQLKPEQFAEFMEASEAYLSGEA